MTAVVTKVGTTTPICEARHVSVAFGDPARTVLSDVTLAANEGEVLAILGPCGCGKSTLLRAMVGLLKPTSGEVFAHGKATRRRPSRHRARLPKFRPLPLAHRPQNIAVALNGLNLTAEQARQRVSALHRHRRPRRLRRCLSERTLRRHETARRHRPRPRPRPRTPLHG